MASTTTAKKGIIDFLWEWAEPKGDWAKLLVDKIVCTESALSATDRDQVFNYFIDSMRTTKRLTPLSVHQPTFSPTAKAIKLTSLHSIQGVNRLAKNQKMEFGNHISIIYGENGTGKTGYGRILKSLGFSYDQYTNVHHNIYGSVEAKSAVIEFSTNSVAKTLNWDGTNNNDDLTNISVFNNNCVQISLADRKLIVSPIGFHLFNIITSELAELTALLNQKKDGYSTDLSFSANLHQGTPQHIFINGLTDKSTEAKLKELTDFPTDIQQTIEEKEKKLTGMNHELLKNEIQNLNCQVTELSIVIPKLQSYQLAFNSKEWDALIALNTRITELEGKSKSGLKDIAEANGIEFYQSHEFKHFLLAAENYINLLDTPYPKDQDKCVYCNQPLEDTAKQLLTSYKKLLTDTMESDLKKEINNRQELIDKIKLIETDLSLNQASFGSDAESRSVQPSELTAFNKQLKTFKTHFVNNTLTTGLIFELDYAKIIKLFQEKKEALEATLLLKNESLRNISEKIQTINQAIHELKDRKLLKEKVEDVKKVILNHKNLKLLNSKSSELGSAAISRKTTEARAELISQRFNEKFHEELVSLRKPHLKIDLSFGTDKGTNKIIQKINQFQLTDILSEGEQKAIALAEFLTELHMDNVTAPVVFDDPVNSLDHHIIDEVAKRLIELSKTRQVIIFTHSILLLNSFIQQSELETSKQAGLDFKFYSVKNNFQDTGILDEVEEVNSFSYYMKKLKAVTDCVDRSLDEAKLAAEGYGHLRSAIEICVEQDVLKQTVKRYRKGVAFPALLRIDGIKLDGAKTGLNDIYEKCCTSIVGHSSPAEIHTTPTIQGLKVDVEIFKKIRTNFT